MKRYEKILFIGGPADGRVEVIEDPQTCYNVPDCEPRPVESWNPNRLSDLNDVAFRVEAYQLTMTRSRDGRMIYFYLHSDLDESKLIDLLIDGYARSKK